MTTTIEWCNETWNPTVGCSRVSRGCEHCFAERVAHRGMSAEHRGLTVVGKHGPRWTGEVRFLPERLATPLSWSRPRKVFVNSMSDLFHEALRFDDIAAIFGVMAASPRHTFQVLTKRPERAREFFAWIESGDTPYPVHGKLARRGAYRAPTIATEAAWALAHPRLPDSILGPENCDEWPLPNVWLGVSVEDQRSADERIPHLLACPAAVRWVSYEPALGPVDFDRVRNRGGESAFATFNALRRWTGGGGTSTGIDWIVVGGESGPGARPFDLAWARSTVEQCREAGVAVFVKQLGALPFDLGASSLGLRDRKGGDMAEWPDDLRVREWPEVV